ncbi:FHA domain-containing protein [Mycobacterium lehmannii]|uniref:FHA domain-containing protein n=1 Tax=Mycobacterium lehmannii TaxID=2048550 RepID=UPI000B941CC8|nr:FHA domain-containing protein [Mycobacterium lehmannii]
MHDDRGPASGASHSQRRLPALTISLADRDYTVYPDDGVVTIGRVLPQDSQELPARIQVDDPRISRTHILIDQAQHSWILTDPGSRNGTFIDGHQIHSVPVNGALTVHLGNANGVVVQLNTTTAQGNDEFRTGTEPHEPHNDSETTTPVPEDDTTETLTPSVQTAVTIDATQIALRRIRTTTLPATTDPDFPPRVNALRDELRRHENTITAHLARAPGRPEVAVILSDVRLTHADLMLKAANSPGGTLGQRLYAARHASRLSADEIATAAGVTASDITAAEAELNVAESVRAAIETVVDALTHRRI